MYNQRDKYSCDPAAKQKKYRNGVPHNGVAKVHGSWHLIKQMPHCFVLKGSLTRDFLFQVSFVNLYHVKAILNF
jgi:hypothetical protein